jgi:hypothetical protein
MAHPGVAHALLGVAQDGVRLPGPVQPPEQVAGGRERDRCALAVAVRLRRELVELRE